MPSLDACGRQKSWYLGRGILPKAESRRGLRAAMNIFNVKDFGAVATEHHVPGPNASVGIQRAIDAAATNDGGGTVYLPSGRYSLEDTITLRDGFSNVDIVGAGVYSGDPRKRGLGSEHSVGPSTSLVWNRSGGRALLEIQRVAGNVISDMTLIGGVPDGGTIPVERLIWCRPSQEDGACADSLVFRDLHLGFGRAGVVVGERPGNRGGRNLFFYRVGLDTLRTGFFVRNGPQHQGSSGGRAQVSVPAGEASGFFWYGLSAINCQKVFELPLGGDMTVQDAVFDRCGDAIPSHEAGAVCVSLGPNTEFAARRLLGGPSIIVLESIVLLNGSGPFLRAFGPFRASCQSMVEHQRRNTGPQVFLAGAAMAFDQCRLMTRWPFLDHLRFSLRSTVRFRDCDFDASSDPVPRLRVKEWISHPEDRLLSFIFERCTVLGQPVRDRGTLRGGWIPAPEKTLIEL